MGEPTGIDLPTEFPGVDPQTAGGWPKRTPRNRGARNEHHGHRCYIVAEPGAPWTVGYNMDLAVGQGAC